MQQGRLLANSTDYRAVLSSGRHGLENVSILKDIIGEPCLRLRTEFGWVDTRYTDRPYYINLFLFAVVSSCGVLGR